MIVLTHIRPTELNPSKNEVWAPCMGSTMLTNLVAALEIHVSVEARQIKYVIFWKAPSIGVVYLVPETGNLALAEPGAM